MRAVNLLPREESKRKRRLTVGVQLAVLSPFVVGSLLAAGYLLASSKVSDHKATLQALRDELAALPPPPAKPEANNDLSFQRSQRITALSAALQSRIAWDRVLREISSVLPEDVWLTTLSAKSPQAPAPTAPSPSTTATTTVPSDTAGNETTTTTTPAPAPVAPVTAPLTLDGYTYSQEGVARLLTRLALIPELQDVKLIQSTQATVAGQIVVSFSIQAAVRRQVPA